jgi:hypothetical protein
MYAYIVGNTGSTVNARKSGTSNHLGTNFTISAANTWLNCGAISAGTSSYIINDKLELMIVSVTGAPSQIAIQLEFTQP